MATIKEQPIKAFTKGKFSSFDDNIKNCKYDYFYNDQLLIVQGYPLLSTKFLKGKHAYVAKFRTMDYNVELYRRIYTDKNNSDDRSNLRDYKYIKKILNVHHFKMNSFPYLLITTLPENTNNNNSRSENQFHYILYDLTSKLNPIQPLILQHQNQLQFFHTYSPVKLADINSLGNNITFSKGIQCSDIEVKKFTYLNRTMAQLAYLMVIGLDKKLDFY